MDKFAYTKIKCYDNCPLQYDLNYIKNIWLKTETDDDVTFGFSFHDYCEAYIKAKGENEEALFNSIKLKYKTLFSKPIGEQLKPRFLKGRDVFHKFYNDVIKNETDCKSEASIEYKMDDNTLLTGKLDIIIKKEDGTIHIIDIKSGKVSNKKLYASQLVFYAGLYAMINKIPYDKITISLFFPLDKDNEEDNPSWQSMMHNIDFSHKEVHEFFLKAWNTITEIRSPNRKKDANVQFLCKYCSYEGYSQYCPKTAGKTPKKKI